MSIPHKVRRPKSPRLRTRLQETEDTEDTEGTDKTEDVTDEKSLKRKLEKGDTPTEGEQVTKRQRLTVPLTNSDRVRLDAESNPNRPAMEKIYRAFYHDDGTRKNDGAALTGHLKELYRIMGDGNADYARDPVSEQEFEAFLKTPDAEVDSQKILEQSVAEHRRRKKDLDEWRKTRTGPRPPDPVEHMQTVEERKGAWRRGDYFYVRNPQRKVTKAERRIAVNVRSQRTALKISSGLAGLYTDPAVSPFIKDHKIYLINSQNLPRTLKYDKLVAYYAPNPDELGDEDTVGNRIADTIEESVEPEDVDGEFAPFYSRIGPHTAWGEEPEAFTQSLKGSFTQSREQVIKSVIETDANRKVASLQDFIGLIGEAFQKSWIDPDNPHRHQEPGETT